jgi:hypothetical protein
MSITYLKIKIKSLAAEAKIIRLEEGRWPGTSTVRHGLHEHRIHEVRSEARAALLAYGYLRGRRYAQLEAPIGNDAPNRRQTNAIDWIKVAKLVAKFGPNPKFGWNDLKSWAESAGVEDAMAAD